MTEQITQVYSSQMNKSFRFIIQGNWYFKVDKARYEIMYCEL